MAWPPADTSNYPSPSRPAGTFPALSRTDDRVAQSHREVLDAVSRAEPPYPIQVAVDVAPQARYYERFADQAVPVAKGLDYVVTGTMTGQPPT